MNETPRKIARILHISDIHFGCADESGQQDRVLEALLVALQPEAGNIDCIVFTGDLAQSAANSEFQQGQEWLVAVSDAMRAPCILVPGNHDVQRNVAEKKELRSAFPSEEAFGMWRREIYKNHPHVRPFLDWFRQANSEFHLFLNEWGANPEIDCVEVETNAGTCRFICLNTALLSCGDDDNKKLCVDIKALNAALMGRTAESRIVIAVGHHPSSYLAPWNQTEFDKVLTQLTGPHLYLHGHLHDLQHASEYKSAGSGVFTAAAGSAYPGATYPKQFSVLEIDPSGSSIRSKVYKFNETGGDWLHDPELSHEVPSRLPSPSNLSPTKKIEDGRQSVSQASWQNPFSDVIANGIPPESVHRLFVEQSDSLTKLKNSTETIVEGQRGTGKTMLLRYFSLEVQSSLIAQEGPDCSVVASMNLHGMPFGIYCCLTNAGLNRSDFDAIENESRRSSLFSHLSYVFIANRFFSALRTLVLQDQRSANAIDLGIRRYTLNLLKLPELSLNQTGADFFTSIVDATDLAILDVNQHIASLLPGSQATAYNPWLSLSANLLGLLERYRKVLGLDSPFFVLVDDFDQLNSEQQSEFFNAASARRHDVVCFKFGIMSGGQKAFTSAPGRTYREGDDYNYVRLDWVDGGVGADSKSSSYVKTVETISARRLSLANWPASVDLSSLFQHWEHGSKLRDESRELARVEYDSLGASQKPKSFESFWTKQGNAKYFRFLAGKKIAHRYAGKATIIDLSSGIFRQFLEICSGIVELALADGWQPSTGKKIGPERQNKAIREWSKDMFRSLGSSGDVSTLKRSDEIITSDHLINFATSLSRYFQVRLLSSSKDPEVIAIAVRGPLPTDSFARFLLEVAVRESVLQRRSVDYPSKSGGGERLPTFILNRRLIPHVGIGAKLQGRHELTASQIRLAAEDVDEFLRQVTKPSDGDQQDLI